MSRGRPLPSPAPSVPRSPALTRPRPAGLLFDIDTFAVHDGPGIRMAVYLKGCPLRCTWCHSPESLRAEPELAFLRDRCVLCGACASLCPQGVHRVGSSGRAPTGRPLCGPAGPAAPAAEARLSAGGSPSDRGPGDPGGPRHELDRARCTACGRCVEGCPAGALVIKGYRMTADEVVAKAARLKPFFDHSGGGVTLTGGEVALQVDFAEAVLAGCQSRGIHTAMETSGACPWSHLRRLLEHCDLVLYDLKLIDDGEHRRWTGASNQRILQNAARLPGRAPGHVQVRVPVIATITDTDENLRGIFAFMADVGLRSVALLPYNPATAAKYEWFGLSCEVQGDVQSASRLADIVALAKQAGLEAAIV